jgi:hypothetical protein
MLATTRRPHADPKTRMAQSPRPIARCNSHRSPLRPFEVPKLPLRLLRIHHSVHLHTWAPAVWPCPHCRELSGRSRSACSCARGHTCSKRVASCTLQLSSKGLVLEVFGFGVSAPLGNNESGSSTSRKKGSFWWRLCKNTPMGDAVLQVFYTC